MFEDRVVRLVTPEMLDPANEGDQDRASAIRVIRDACARAIKGLLVEDRFSLVLLSPADIGSGVLEALLNCELDGIPGAADLAADIIALEVEEPRFLLAICMPQLSLESWKAPEDGDRTEASDIKNDELLVRLFASYGLAMTIPNLGERTADAESLLQSYIERVSRTIKNSDSHAWSQSFKKLKEDILVLSNKTYDLLSPETSGDFGDESRERAAQFLHVISRLDQFGKRPVSDVTSAITHDAKKSGLQILHHYKDGSYGLRQQLNLAIKRHTADELAKLYGRLQDYRLFRDAARWLGDGAFPWARSLVETRSKPFLVLFIDESLDASDGRALCAIISEIFALLFGGHGYEVNAIRSPEGVFPTKTEADCIGESIVGIDRFYEDVLVKRIKKVTEVPTKNGDLPYQWKFSELDQKREWHEYDAIFCEVDYRTRFAGPQVVQKLASYLERTAAQNPKLQVPALIVLTHMDNFGHVQQCLNLGANAFVNKQRMFQIPSRLKRAYEDVRHSSRGRTSAHINFPPGKQERSGEHSNFRTLYSLRPDRRADLRSRDIEDRVVGGWCGRHAPVEQPGAEYRKVARWDARDRDWIRSLPKADLHCHFGTSISLLTVEALAFNTCGHLFENWTRADLDPKMLPSPLSDLIKDICEIIRTAAGQIAQAEEGNPRPAVYVFRAMEKQLFEPLGREPAKRVPDDPYGEVVKALMKRKPPVKEYVVVSLLVAVNACLRDKEVVKHVLHEWKYFRDLYEWCKAIDDVDHSETPAWIKTSLIQAARLGVQGVFAVFYSMGPASGISVNADPSSWTAVLDQKVSVKQCGTLWDIWHKNINNRIKNAYKTITTFLHQSSTADEAPISAPTLEQLVALPGDPEPQEHNLPRYLWGCGLLGADHLQYPENILLAAHDLVHQNADDWVIYNEVRCETPGYTLGGLSSELATDLLRAGFDLAAVFERERNKRPLIRTNILLAAKRHKKTEDLEKVVSLLARYLARPPEFPPDLFQGLPGWWRPAQVVGFDLSGKEDENPAGLREQIGRLIELSSPITIHAGEAASAESIWRAVYENHARRIGHGVRLREQNKLLRFCINEGICMEMCPISNKFTSDFIIVGEDNTKHAYDPLRIEHYPLKHFLDCGLEVCINTDNRSLHAEYGKTLTDEYMWAAVLSGGFSRWEVLKLIKAGFKHAFIEKHDIQELIQAVEYWIFGSIADAPGLDWQAALRRDPDI
jgi:adenosine deaminase